MKANITGNYTEEFQIKNKKEESKIYIKFPGKSERGRKGGERGRRNVTKNQPNKVK